MLNRLLLLLPPVRNLVRRYVRAHQFEADLWHQTAENLSTELAALAANYAEANLLLGQLVYDDPEFDGEIDVMAEVRASATRAASRAMLEIRRLQEDGYDLAVPVSHEHPLFFFEGETEGLVD